MYVYLVLLDMADHTGSRRGLKQASFGAWLESSDHWWFRVKEQESAHLLFFNLFISGGTVLNKTSLQSNTFLNKDIRHDLC